MKVPVRRAALICLLEILSIYSFGQPAAAKPQSTSQSAPVATPPTYIPFGKLIKKAVAFIYTHCDGDDHQYEGTGFFVLKDDVGLGDGRGFGYLVTNRHVAEPSIETGQPCKITDQVIRINTLEPDPNTKGRNVLFRNNLPWIYPHDDAVDLAAISFVPDQTKFDVQPIPVSMFVTADLIKKENIAEGDSVLYAGYFYQFPGSLETEPIIRQGIIAMIPDEPMLTTLGKPGRAYLADAHVFGGNSGSPMFVSLGAIRNGVVSGSTRYFFLGVVSGLEPEDTSVALQPVATYSGKLAANSGVSFIVPADEVLKLLDDPTFVAQRANALKALPPQKPVENSPPAIPR